MSYSHTFELRLRCGMSRLFSSREVISFFSGEDEGLSEVIFPGSEDELGMEDEEDDDFEPEFEPLEVPEG